MDAIAYLLVFIFGACIGSFLNVVVYRLPAKLSLIHPPSRCPKCLHPLGKTENVPILGWLWLKGKCRWCKTPISPRYPIIETITGLLFLLIYTQFSLSFLTFGYWVLISWLLALALIDLDIMILPNQLTQSGLILGLIFQGVKGWLSGGLTGLAYHLAWGVIGMVIGIWSLDLIGFFGTIILRKSAMGGGDPKLFAMIGAWLGWKALLVSGFLACGIGTVFGFGGIFLKRLERFQRIPFGPFLALGALISVFWSDIIITIYQQFLLNY
jgi:leader peptidase (prepilin peptidase) / N-methyltransferase